MFDDQFRKNSCLYRHQQRPIFQVAKVKLCQNDDLRRWYQRAVERPRGDPVGKYQNARELSETRINTRPRKSRNPKFAQNYALCIQYVTTANLHKKGGLVLGYRPPVFRRSMQRKKHLIKRDRGAADLIPVRHAVTEYPGTFSDREYPCPY